MKSIVEHPNVDITNIGVWSHSNGITLASGLLGREKYSELSGNVKFLLDNEGPHCPRDIINNKDLGLSSGATGLWATVLDAKIGDGKDYSTEEDFWYERCAVNFIGNYKGIYQRTQAIKDHALGENYFHAVTLLNSATNGNVKWTRLNNQTKNQIYSTSDIGNFLDIDKLDDVNDKYIWDILFELIEQE